MTRHLITCALCVLVTALAAAPSHAAETEEPIADIRDRIAETK